MSSIQDLTTAVNALTAAVAAQPAPGTTTVLSPADQAELDADVTAVEAATTTLTPAPPT
jgi:hypothetical protein